MSTATETTISPDAIWDMEVNESKKGDYTPCPAGNHPGRIAALFDVGHQPDTRTDSKTGVNENIEVRKLVIVYELTKKQPNGDPYVMADRLTWSMNDKSNFFGLVTNLTGEKLANGQKFNPTSLLGRPVMVSVVHKPGKEDRSYANVGSVSQFPEGFPVPEFRYAPFAWSVKEGRPFPDLTWLPLVFGKTIKALAEGSAEARGFAPPNGAAPAQPPVTQQPAPTRAGDDPVPPAVAPLLAKYRLPWPYTGDHLDRLGSLVADPDRAVLEQECPIPF